MAREDCAAPDRYQTVHGAVHADSSYSRNRLSANWRQDWPKACRVAATLAEEFPREDDRNGTSCGVRPRDFEGEIASSYCETGVDICYNHYDANFVWRLATEVVTAMGGPRRTGAVLMICFC